MRKRLVRELNDAEYTELVINVGATVKEAKAYCEKYNIDFDDVRNHDWGYRWQR